jgi:RNA polymerase sigma-70 factor, ECF subfamily
MSDSQTFGPAATTPEEVLDAALNGARKGEEAAFATLWRIHNSKLTRFVQIRLLNSSIDYEEVVSETWLNVARDIRKFKGSSAEFTGWLYAIARNRIVDATRIRDRQARSSQDIEEVFWLPSPTNVEKEFEANETVNEAVNAIAQLPAAQSEVLLLRIVSDLSVEETALVVKKNANAVRVLSHRGLIALREKLGGLA